MAAILQRLTVLVLIVCTCYISEVYNAKDLPPYFPRCHRFDPKLNSCLLKATETVRPYLKKGVPELNLPSIEPFGIPEVTLQQGTTALNFKAVLKDVLIRGLSNYRVTQFDFDVPNLQFFCALSVDKITIEGNYTVNGKILLVPIVGNGKFIASVDNTNATLYQKVALKKKNGLEYLTNVFTNTSIQVAGPKAHLDGLFNGNEELSKTTQKVINDNVDELFKEIKPVIEKVLTSVIEDYLLKAFEDQVPFKRLYPTD